MIDKLELNYELFENVVGSKEAEKVAKVAKGEKLLLNVGTAKTMGEVTNVRKAVMETDLSIPVCGLSRDRVAISRRIGGRWRLIGVGTISG